MTAEELAAIESGVDLLALDAPAGQDPEELEGAESAPEALPAEAVEAPPKPTGRPAPRTLTGDVLPDAQAMSLAATVFPGRKFDNADHARASLQGLLAGNAGRATKLAQLESAHEKLEHENPTLKARASATAPPAPGAGAAPASAAPKGPAAVEAQEFLTQLGPQGWAYYDRLFDGEGLPEGVDASAGRRYALAGLFREFSEFQHGKRAADRDAVKAEVLSEVEKQFGERIKTAEAPALQQRKVADAAKLFFELGARSVEDATGDPLYPELTDRAAVKEIGRIFVQELGSKLTDEAAEAAIWRFRSRNPDWAPAAEADDAGAGGSPSTAAADTVGRTTRPNGGARGALTGTGVPGHGLPTARRTTSSGVDVEKNAEAEQSHRDLKEFGFRTHRSAAI